MKEICDKYQVTRKVAMRRIEHFDIPKIYEGRNVSFSKNAVDRYFAELIEEFDKEEYYTIQQIMDKFSMSYSAVLSFAMRHKIPRMTRHREVFYSKPHVDSLKGCGEDEDAPGQHRFRTRQRCGCPWRKVRQRVRTSSRIIPSTVECTRQGSRNGTQRTNGKGF